MSKIRQPRTIYVRVEKDNDGTELFNTQLSIEHFDYPNEEPVTILEYRLVAAREVRRTLSMK